MKSQSGFFVLAFLVLIGVMAAVMGCDSEQKLESAVGDSATDASGSRDLYTPPPCTADTLNDPENCGACGHSCLGSPCNEGICEPTCLVSDRYTNRFANLALHDQFVYWSDTDRDYISRVHIDGGDEETILDRSSSNLPGLLTLSGLTISDGRFVWINYETDEIQAMDLDANNQVTLYDPYNRFVSDFSVRDGDPFLYAVDCSNNSIVRIARNGGDEEVVFTENQAIARLTSNSRYLAWIIPSENSDGVVRSLEKGSDSAVTIADGLYKPIRLVVDEDYAYYAEGDYDHGEVRIHRCPIAGGDSEVLRDAGVIVGMTIDDNYLYWSTFHSVHRVPLSGGERTVLADFPLDEGRSTGSPGQLVVDDQWIYWLDNDSNEAGPVRCDLYKVAK